MAIFIVFFDDVFFKVSRKTILISPLAIGIETALYTLWIDKEIILFIVIPVHNFTVITFLFSNIFFSIVP
ncbi:hypothetical protein C1940_16700 (plasmid) [Lactiplantibacillus plantarum subsp. plantarum]|nr:hypothetical protein C1940_16700 [Lactiplantibacillus plantarum subsp. plantarum]